MTADIIRERKDDIVNLFQVSNPPVVVGEIAEAPGTESSADIEDSASDDSSKVAKAGKKRRNLSLKINWVPLNDLTGPLLISAAKSGDVNAVRLWLAVVGDIEYKGKDHCTALIWAGSKGHTEVVRLLLENGANIEAAKSTGATALLIAAQGGNLETVGLLLEKGANIEAATINSTLYRSAEWIFRGCEAVIGEGCKHRGHYNRRGSSTQHRSTGWPFRGREATIGKGANIGPL